MLSGQIDAMGGGDYGDMYLQKSAKGEDFELKYILKSFYFGIGVAQGQPRAAAVAQHLHLHAEERRHAGGAVAEVPGRPAARAAGLLIGAARSGAGPSRPAPDRPM